MTDFLSVSEDEGGVGRWAGTKEVELCHRGLAPGGEWVTAPPGGQMMVKLPVYKTLVPRLPWLCDSMQGT